MQPEGEQRTVGHRVFGCRPCEQCRADRCGSRLSWCAGNFCKICCCGGNRRGSTADQTPGTRELFRDPECALDPRCERIASQLLVARCEDRIVGFSRGPRRDGRGQCRRRGVGVGGGTHKRFGHHMLRPHFSAEDARGHGGHFPLLFCDAPAAGHRRGGTDTLQGVVGAAGLPHATHQHPDIGTLATPVGVQFIEHQELQTLRRPDERGSFIGSG